MDSNRKRFRLNTFVSESLLIILSVLFALFINEWRNTYKYNQRTKSIINNVKKEITHNKIYVEKLSKYHQSIIDNIRDVIKKDSIEAVFFPSTRFNLYGVAPNGIIQGYIDEIAWLVAKQENITNRIEFEQSRALYRAYDQQAAVKKTIETIIDILVQRELQRKELLHESITIFAMEINELIGQEKMLIIRYNEVLETLEK